MKVLYREPTYEEATGPKKEPYSWIYTIIAEDERAARRLALDEFEAIGSLSGVGWAREVVGVEVSGPG